MSDDFASSLVRSARTLDVPPAEAKARALEHLASNVAAAATVTAGTTAGTAAATAAPA
jgi:hypothetical protein